MVVVIVRHHIVSLLILKILASEKALKAQVGSPVGYGSEFQKGELLLPLLKNHPLWN